MDSSSRRKSRCSWFVRVMSLSCVLLATLANSGCGVSWLLHGAAGGERDVRIPARYLGLANKRVAVLVAAHEYILFQNPQADRAVCQELTTRIAANVQGVSVMDPDQIIEFQRKNPHWTTIPHGRLVKSLDVDRIVMVDLSEYRTNEPGNAYVWKGVLEAKVGVLEAESDDPDVLVFREHISVQYPENSNVGLVNTNEPTIEMGMLRTFGRDGGGLFYDHQIHR